MPWGLRCRTEKIVSDQRARAGPREHGVDHSVGPHEAHSPLFPLPAQADLHPSFHADRLDQGACRRESSGHFSGCLRDLPAAPDAPLCVLIMGRDGSQRTGLRKSTENEPPGGGGARGWKSRRWNSEQGQEARGGLGPLRTTARQPRALRPQGAPPTR